MIPIILHYILVNFMITDEILQNVMLFYYFGVFLAKWNLTIFLMNQPCSFIYLFIFFRWGTRKKLPTPLNAHSTFEKAFLEVLNQQAPLKTKILGHNNNFLISKEL